MLKTILDTDDEVIILAPFFAEYLFYVENHGGKSVVIPPVMSTLTPNLEILEEKITQKTKALIINTPNNPTGIIYSEEILTKIAAILAKKESLYGITILVISDEPYKKLIYDEIKLPHLLNIFDHAAIINSFSKSLALPGERIGYIALSPKLQNADELMSGLIFCNRTLGYVNAPSLFQKVVADCINVAIATDEYKKRRDFLYENLILLGFECIKPQGAFYLFPKSPIVDDVTFVKSALKYNLLLVPGTGFGCSGHFRMSYSINFETIQNSISAFTALAKEYGLFKNVT